MSLKGIREMRMSRYAMANLPPLLLLILGALFGGWFGVAALIWLTVLATFLDHFLKRPFQGTGPDVTANVLPVILGIGHLLMLPLVAWALVQPDRGWGESIALFFATASFLGQVSHPNSHELIHRTGWLRKLGMACYTAMLFGHHSSAHILVHHRFVGTDDDPNSPLPGEGFWTYAPRAWIGSFVTGLEQERRILARRSAKRARTRSNPYWFYVIGALAVLPLMVSIAGPAGLMAYVLLSMMGQMQILLSDYIQHYGLRRMMLASGHLEPVGPHHSWNAPRGFTSYLMMNAPSHSEHHMHPNRPYDVLQTASEAPKLPWSLPIMACIAVVPRQWRRIMDKRAEKVMARAREALQSRGPMAASA